MTTPLHRVFYSWQSDLPNRTNRGLIGAALEAALGGLTATPTREVEAAPDRDTEGVPGAPDIATTIFQKIDAAAVFVADVSLVTPSGAERPAPNPNVLIELGYAMRALGPSRVVLVLNEHFGPVNQLPFDLRSRRVLTYINDPDLAERSAARQGLTKALTSAIEACLKEASADIAAQAGIRIMLANLFKVDKPRELFLEVDCPEPWTPAGVSFLGCH